jgi:PST family polysaccharide transporter
MRRGSHVFWSGLEAGTSAALSFASAFIVARIVGPAEFGVGAASVAMHVLLWVAVNALFADALVQRAELDEDAASSAFWVSAAAGAGAGLLQAVSGLALAASFGDPRLVPMALLLALPLPLVGAGGAVQGMLTRRRAYKVLAGRAVIGQGLGTATGVAAALLGAGAWALVLQQAVTSTVGALALLLRSHWRPRPVLRWDAVRGLLRTGLPLTASTLVQQSRYRLFAVMIGATAGPAALGMVHLAFRLSDTVRDLALTALWRLMLPPLSERQHDLPALQAAVDRYAFLTGLALFPVIGAMLLVMRPLVRLGLGPVWEPAAAASAPLLLLMVWLFLGFAGGVASVARGGARYAMVAQIAVTAATLGGVAVLRPATPLAAVGIWCGAQLLTSPYLVATTARLLHAGLLRQQRPGLPAIEAFGSPMAAAAMLPPLLGPLPPVALIAARLGVLGGVYLAGAALLLRGRLRAAVPTMEPA